MVLEADIHAIKDKKCLPEARNSSTMIGQGIPVTRSADWTRGKISRKLRGITNLPKAKAKLGREFSDSGGAESTGLLWRGHQRETIAWHIQGVAGLV